MPAESDDALAARLAEAAGRHLLGLRERLAGVPSRQLRAAGDREAQELLAAALACERPRDAVLSEEAEDDRTRLGAERVWIVDPLDGTNEYGEAGRTDWAVHVALWQAGELVAGAVALPAQGRVLATGAPLPDRGGPTDPPRLVISRSRRPSVADVVAEALGAQVRRVGSAGAKAATVVLGEADVYVHAGAMHEWDTAAPVAVARAAGLYAGRLDGAPLEFNTPPALTTQLLVCHPALAERVLAAAGMGRVDGRR